jgi:molybdopterin-guanine dinucleotide biosynthesis protein A
MRHSAVLLAGGKSSRMGRDKAFLEIEGQPLWRRQIETLRTLSPEQLMISGPPQEAWREFEIVADVIAGAGPLAGVATALRKCPSPRLVVLAVDLPAMRADFLRSLLARCSDDQGVVPRSSRGFEPLAAVYPASCVALAATSLLSRDFSMESFVQGALRKKLVREHTISPPEEHLFANLNTPADYESARRHQTHSGR